MPSYKPPSGPYLALSQDLCRCGFYHGSNMGRRLWCLMYYGDVQLTNYLDDLAEQVGSRLTEADFARAARVIRRRHGLFLRP